MVKSILRVEHIHHSPVDRLYDYNTCVEVCLLVCVPHDPVDKCPEEISLTELDDPGRILIDLGSRSV